MVLLVIQRCPKFGNEDLYFFHLPLQHLGEQEQRPALTSLEAVIVVPLSDLLHQLQNIGAVSINHHSHKRMLKIATLNGTGKRTLSFVHPPTGTLYQT